MIIFSDMEIASSREQSILSIFQSSSILANQALKTDRIKFI
ncbi:MAG TPA: hypothetical protein VLZ28_04550 [Daejeonella sp.]|nr:hypothetical protein [Daejeonella sp.]